MTARLIFLALVFAATPVQARMYQWTDPETGTTQLSGKPPAWYRSAEHGPRVIVFEKGRIIDDTSIKVSDSLREELRRQALANAVEDKDKARQLAEQARELKTKIDNQEFEGGPEPAESERTAALPDTLPPPELAPAPANEPVYKEMTEDDLRALISDWEKQKTEQSREKIGVDTE